MFGQLIGTSDLCKPHQLLLGLCQRFASTSLTIVDTFFDNVTTFIHTKSIEKRTEIRHGKSIERCKRTCYSTTHAALSEGKGVHIEAMFHKIHIFCGDIAEPGASSSATMSRQCINTIMCALPFVLPPTRHPPHSKQHTTTLDSLFNDPLCTVHAMMSNNV